MEKELRTLLEKSECRPALLFIDLDHFKNINDSFGHETGDRVIRTIASRIADCLDGAGILARFGGDEFIVLVERFETRNDLEWLAREILSCVARPLPVETMNLFVTCSVGIAVVDLGIRTPHDMIKHADTAMYGAKESGRNTYRFYVSEMTEMAFERVLMETGVRMALEKGEFELYYQPIVDGAEGAMVGVEALIRWNHEPMGVVFPSAFIPLAEETGLIVDLDRWAMETGMRKIARWIERGYAPGRLSLNLSVKFLQHERFFSDVEELLRRTGCRPEWITFEITESHIMHNVHHAVEVLEELRKAGFSIAVDDFGTGYSSLAYLKHFPVEKLKIDRSFIRDIPENREDVAITRAIIAVGKSLGMEVVAEGIETEAQKELLQRWGCRLMQGYLFYRPMPARELEKILQNVSEEAAQAGSSR